MLARFGGQLFAIQSRHQQHDANKELLQYKQDQDLRCSYKEGGVDHGE